ncbi:MAG: apolipoprotein N-acyltransferase [Alphaproteobacteria bacterium]
MRLPAALDRLAPDLEPFARRIGALRGVRRIGLALLLGIALAATLPPVHALPLFPVAFVGFIWLIGGARSGAAAFATGFWFGLGFFLAGLYWIGFALMTDPERYGWLVAPAVIGIAGGLALFIAFAALLLRLLRLDGLWRVLAFALIWTGAEWLRGHVLSGFPWNLAGSAFSLSDAMMQLAALLGAYGVSLVVVFAGALPALLGESTVQRRRLALPGMLLILVAVWLGGTIRLADAPEPGSEAAADAPMLRIVQPNIAQNLKWLTDERAKVVAKHLELTMLPADDPPDLVIWPEAAMPFVIDEDPAVLAYLTGSLPQGAVLITGAPRRRAEGPEGPRVWNSLYVASTEGVLARYDKHHLVPFGEYVPLRGLLGLDKITAGTLDFSEGPGPQTLAVPGLPPFSPSICYEAIFPAGVVAHGELRPAWLLNLTNDGWFGVTSGPYQHLASARLRAVEEGLPLVRAANTGISAVVDPYGRLLARLPLGAEGVIDAALPARAASPTPYSRVGDWPLFGMLIMGSGLVLLHIAGYRVLTARKITP